MKKTKLVALILALLMLTACSDLLAPITGTDGQYIENEYFTYIVPDPIDFNTLSYESADMDKIETAFKELAELGQTATDFNQIVEKQTETDMLAYEMLTNGSIANAHYSLDRTNEEYEANDLEATENRIAATTMSEEAYLAVLEGPYMEQFRELIGEEYADDLLENGAKSDEHVALLEEEALLVQEYNEKYIEAYTYEYGGKVWDIDMLYDESEVAGLAQEELQEIYYALSTLRNEALATTFSDLVEIRKQIAVFEGYDNYADYMYDKGFGRDYTPQDAMELNDAVSEFVAPLFEAVGMAMYAQSYFDIDTAEAVSMVKENLLEVSPLFEEPFDYMMDNNLLLYTEDAENAYNGAFCSDLYLYDAPLMFLLGQSATYNVQTLIHEFGHYTEAYYNTIDFSGEPSVIFDLAEVHAIGLEVLMYQTSYEEIFDDNEILFADIAKKLSAIIDASIFDDFLQQIYATDHKLSVDEINQIFFDVEAKYRPLSMSWGYSWADVPHNFEAPFYYISYGVATLHAMDIFRMVEEEGVEFATDKYFELMAESMTDLEYSEIMANVDMQTFKDEGYVESIMLVVEEELAHLAG